MDWFRRIFVRLRWKLMAAYALVTTVAVAGVIVTAVGFQAYRIIYDGDFLARWHLYNRLALTARDVMPALRTDPVDSLLLERRLAEFLVPTGGRPTTVHQPPLTARNVGLLAVVDAEGRVLAAAPSGTIRPGTSLREHLPASGDIVVNEVLFGTQANASPELGIAAERDSDSRHLYVGTPIWEAGVSPRGALLIRYDPNLRDVLVSGLVMPSSPPLGSTLIFLVSVGVTATVFGLLSAGWITRRLGRFVTAAESWSRADFSRTIEDASRDELGELGGTLIAGGGTGGRVVARCPVPGGSTIRPPAAPETEDAP